MTDPLVVVALALTGLTAGLGALALVVTGYLFVLTLFAGRHPPQEQPADARTLRFAFVIPAHNEQSGIAATVASALAATWPADRRAVVVVADNCNDDTAAVARAAGAVVIERNDTSKRGKGYALERGFDAVLQHGAAGFDVDAVVVVDADSVVSENFLTACAARLAAGAQALQAEYGVRNVHASWRTELMTLALAMFHTLRSNARERLGVSVGLRGNGMCFSRACLLAVPPQAYGLVEDVEHGIALGRAGVRVVAVNDAHVWGEMVSSSKASESQRRRWEDGRQALKRDVLPALLRDAVRTRSAVLLDLSLDVLVPPLSTIALLVMSAVVTAVARAVVLLVGFDAVGVVDVVDAVAVGALLPVLFLCSYVARGLALSGLGFGGVVALARAPGYVVWKLALKLRGKPKDGGWVRTAREDAPPP